MVVQTPGSHKASERVSKSPIESSSSPVASETVPPSSIESSDAVRSGTVVVAPSTTGDDDEYDKEFGTFNLDQLKLIDRIVQDVRMKQQKMSSSLDNCVQCGMRTSKAGQCTRSEWPLVPRLSEQGQAASHGDEAHASPPAPSPAKRMRMDDAPAPACSSSSPQPLCGRCKKTHSCGICKSWECASCAADHETVRRFKEFHKIDPDVKVDCYGRREYNPYHALKLSVCVECGRKVCVDDDCGIACSLCKKRICQLHPIQHPWCDSCAGVIGNNDDFDIGPINRKEGVCSSCWPEVTHCDCGERISGSSSSDEYDSSESDPSAESDPSESTDY